MIFQNENEREIFIRGMKHAAAVPCEHSGQTQKERANATLIQYGIAKKTSAIISAIESIK